MIYNQTTPVDICHQPDATLLAAIFLVIFALPFHLLLMKILYKDCELTLPHHKVMMSLTLSDALQIFTASAFVICRKILSLVQNQEEACKYSILVGQFFITVTLIISSINIVTLSIERYISCIYGLHVYIILTARRVVSVLVAQWIIAVGFGVIVVVLQQRIQSPVRMTNSSMTQPISVLVIFPSATMIAMIQLRLLLFSHSKLATVKPQGGFGTNAELVDFRKRQVKITFVASIVAVAYIVCMFPIAILHAYEWQHGDITDHPLKFLLIALAMLNTLVDPVIYGFGVQDTRKLMWKNIRQVKDFILWHACGISFGI